jgi:uncharacterized protein (DUF697 family)
MSVMRRDGMKVKGGGSIVTYVHGVSSGRLLAGVALGESPVEGVGEAVLAEVAEGIVLNLEGGDVGYIGFTRSASRYRQMIRQHTRLYSRDWRMASSEKASMKVAS